MMAAPFYDWKPAPLLRQPAAGTISLFLVDLDLLEEAELDVLSDAERARAGDFHFEEDRQHFLAARFALRTILAGILHADPHEVILTAGPHGKPELGGIHGGAFHFNLSHSGGHLVLAVAPDQPVGVDLEDIESEVEMEPLVEHYFPLDLQWQFKTARVQERTWAFFEAWTALEACTKADGRGLHDELSKTDLSAWHVKNLRIVDRFAAAVSAPSSFQLHTYTWPS